MGSGEARLRDIGGQAALQSKPLGLGLWLYAGAENGPNSQWWITPRPVFYSKVTAGSLSCFQRSLKSLYKRVLLLTNAQTTRSHVSPCGGDDSFTSAGGTRPRASSDAYFKGRVKGGCDFYIKNIIERVGEKKKKKKLDTPGQFDGSRRIWTWADF